MSKKILYIAPHLSTGGMPQYLCKQIELLKNNFEIYCIEWSNVTGGVLVIQRNKIQNLIESNLITLGENKEELFDIIKNIKPDVIHLQEIPELFMPYEVAKQLYKTDRKYVIIETSHDSSGNPKNKLHFPDKFIFVSQYQVNLYKELNIPSEVVEYPIEYFKKTKTKEEAQRELGMDSNLKHVINVGLFTPRKNQAEIIEYAKLLKNYPIQFHFIGNQADNFKYYWEPLMKDFPSNCKWWNERTDVETFYQAADLFLFTSRGNNSDKETMPLVIREAISWQVPSLIYNLEVYMNYFNRYSNIQYLDLYNKQNNSIKILEILNLNNSKMFNVKYDSTDNKIFLSSNQSHKNITVSIKDAESNSVIWSAHYNDFYANVDYWIIPTPKSFIDFETSPLVSELLVEFYNDSELVENYFIEIKKSTIKKYKLKLKNNTEPTFNNYVEFFVDKIYDNYLKGKTYETIVDVGANTGLWIEYIQNVSNTNKIYAVEPNTKALKCLKQSYDNIVIVDSAMSDVDGELDFYVDNENSTISSTIQYGSLQNSYKVKSVTFKKFIETYHIDKVNLLKIDIETGEYPLIESLQKEDFEKIDNILVEYHLLEGRTYDKDVKNIISILEANGFYLDIKKMHAIGGFIFASKEEIKKSLTDAKNIELKNVLDEYTCGDKRNLAELVNKLFPNGVGVEIGVLRGDYSKIILERWRNGTLYLVDTWRHIENYIDLNGRDDNYHYECLIKTCQNIKPWQNRAHIIRMDSSLSADLFPDEYFDFIYIDADHSYEGVKTDLEKWWPKIKKGGLFCGDDYIPDDGDIWLLEGDKKTYAGKFGVRKAVTEFSQKNNLQIYETKDEVYWKQWYTFKPF